MLLFCPDTRRRPAPHPAPQRSARARNRSEARRLTAVWAAALVLGAFLPAARAARVQTTPEALRCGAAGLCTTVVPTQGPLAGQQNALFGAFRVDAASALGGQPDELQFDALWRPYDPPAGQENLPFVPWCVRLKSPSGEVLDTLYGHPGCLALWAPNWRDPMSEADKAALFAHTVQRGVIVHEALAAALATAAPEGAEAAWGQVVQLMEHLAATVSYLGG